MPELYKFDFMKRGFPYTDEDGNLLGSAPDVPTNDPNVNPPGTPPPSTPAIPVPAPYEARTGKALDALEAQLKNQPVMSKPKWWQGLAAGAAGFGAGWSNAASRTRHPIDVDEMTENILHPGYRQRMAEWKSRVAPLEEDVKLSQSADAGERARRLQAAQEQYYGARSNEANAKAAKAARDKAATVLPGKETEQQKYAAAFGITGDPEKSTRYAFGWGAPPAEKDPAHHNFTVDDILLAPVGTYTADQVKQATDLFNKIHRDHGGSTVDPLVEERRRQLLEEGEAKAFDTIENTKRTAEAGILRARKADIDKLVKGANAASNNPKDATFYGEEDLKNNPITRAQLENINKTYAPQLQAVQDNYARSIRSRHKGGAQATADDYKVDPTTLAYDRVTGNPAPPRAASATPAAKGAKAASQGGGGSPNDLVTVNIDGVAYHGPRKQIDALLAEAKRQKLIKE